MKLRPKYVNGYGPVILGKNSTGRCPTWRYPIRRVRWLWTWNHAQTLPPFDTDSLKNAKWEVF